MQNALLLALTFATLQLFGQADTIQVNSQLAIDQLKPGLHQYLVYFEMEKNPRPTGFSLWNRQVGMKTNQYGKVIEIVQQWFGSDTTFNRYVYSLSKASNFEPIYHYTKSTRGIEAFNFASGKIVGADTVANNSKNPFELRSEEMPLNWELDMEIFNTLPIKKTGQRFFINFYHPGGRSAPRFYEYAVIGEESISIVGAEQMMKCWQLKINYSPTDWAIFWISKKTREVIKMQEQFRGGFRFKVRTATPILPGISR